VTPTGADVIVVGAGPAGAATAIWLARAGHDVLLLDRARFPRAKPCGDCLSAAAGALLLRLGVLAEVEAAAPARLAGWRIHAPAGHFFEGAFPREGAAAPPPAGALALPRERLDAVLAGAAARAGAHLLEGVRVLDVRAAGGGRAGGAAVMVAPAPGARPVPLRARLVVGADGLRSVVARRLGLIRREPRLRKLSLTAHVRGVSWPPGAAGDGPAPAAALAGEPAPGGVARGEMHLADGACAGLAPVAAGPDPLWNLTVVVDAGRFGAQVAADPAGFFQATLARFPALRERVHELRFLPHAHGRRLLASGPFDWATRAVVAPGAALVGDAAGYYDPFTGQGIYQALASAELLAQEADDALRGRARAGARTHAPLHGYARRRARLLRGARALQHLIEAVLARPMLADAALARLRQSRAAADALVAVTGDLRRAGSLLDPRLLFSLLAPGAPAEVTE